MSERSRTPAHLKDQIEDKDSQIRELQFALSSLEFKIKKQEEELRQKNIRISQQAETIQIHSDEIAKTHQRSTKFDATPIRYPSQQGLVKRFQDQALPPPPAYNQPAQLPVTIAPHYRTKWGDVPQAVQHQETRQGAGSGHDIFDQRTFPMLRSPEQSGQQSADGSGSPSPLYRMRSLVPATYNQDPSRGSFTTPPRAVKSATNINELKLTPDTSNSSGQVGIPPIPLHTPERPDSVASKPRSTKDGAITPFGASGSKPAALSKAFSELFDHVVEFAYIYVNVPSTQADSNLSQELKQRLMNAATKTTAHKIMSSQNTRYLLIAKIILSWIQSNVFAEIAFVGLDKSIDDAIIDTRKKIFNNTPAPVRFVFLQEIANQFVRLKKAPNYQEFFNTLSHKRAVELWNIVRPMMYKKVDGDWQNMHDLMQEAHRAAELQLLDTAEFRLFFPKLHDPFNDASMINMDPEFDEMAPDELMARRASVRLGAVPQVMARVTSPDGNIMTRTLVKAGVLLKFETAQKK